MKKRIMSLILCLVMILSIGTSVLADGNPVWENAVVDAAETNAGVAVNSTNFPDANFRQWIIANLPVSGSASSGYTLSQASIDAVTELNLRGVGIKDAKGVERFTNLVRLVLWDNEVSKLDLSKNVNLEYLDLDNNQLAYLDLSKNVNLSTLYCSGQVMPAKPAAIKDGNTYLFNLTQLVPKSNLGNVELGGSILELNTSTGTATLNSMYNSFTYRYRTGNSTFPTITVTAQVSQWDNISKPTISTQPTSQTVVAGEKVSFKVVAKGGQLTYQWQYRTSSSDSWKNVSASSGKTATYTLTAAAKHNGYQYRCVIRNMAGKTNSKVVTLTLTTKPKILTQPTSQNVPLKTKVSFTVKAGGSNLKYQWQYRTSSSGSWKNVSASSGKKATYTLTAQARHNGYQYRCRVTNGNGKVYTKAATLNVGKPIIKVQPTTQTVTKGNTAEFSVTVRGGGLKFQWYYRTSPTGKWKKVAVSNASTYQMTTSVLAVQATASTHGYQYRCVITNSYGKATSKTVTLYVKNGPKISKQPSNVSTYAGEKASFSVKASGTSLKYQWQYRTSSSGSWANVSASSGKKATYTLTAEERHNGYQYRCVVKNSYGKMISQVASLKVEVATTHYRALMVGEENFPGDICTRNRADVENMKAMLATVKGPTGPKYTVTTKFDLGSIGLENAIRATFKDTTNQDVSLFFIATHGNSDGDGELAMIDGSFVDFGTLANWLNQYVKGDVIVIIESCGAGSAVYPNGEGAQGGPSDEDYDAELLTQQIIAAFANMEDEAAANAGRGAMRQSRFYVLAAAAHHQVSWGHEGSNPGNMFTDWLIEGVGLSGAMPADTNNNKILTLNELYNYIAQYNDYVIAYGATQQVQVYPENSSFKLWKR